MRTYTFPFITLAVFLLSQAPLLAVRDSAMESFSSPAIGKDSADYSDASAEGTHFIALIDQQQYRSAWNDAGPILRELVSVDIWSEGVRLIREPLGSTTSRKLVSHEQLASIPGGLSGSFYRIHYRAQFYDVGSKEETLLLMDEGLGKWRVISYSIN